MYYLLFLNKNYIILIIKIQKCVDKFKYIWVFNIDNMRNYYLKEVRNDLNTSR